MRRPWIWTFPVALAATTFWLSSRSTLPMDVSLGHPLDWICHACEFAALALALEVAARNTFEGTPVYRRHLWIFLLVSLYGASDELHQHFVPGRDVDVLDWVADTCGGFLGLAASCLPLVRRRWLTGLSWHRGEARRPDPDVPLILVADPHWNAELTGLEGATRANPGADWLFLGDTFDVWVGIPGMETPPQAAFLAWVDERRRQGRWVGFWLGNREYFLDARSGHFDLMGEGIGGGLPAEGLAWEHGDLINHADWQYRLWNLVSRSGPLWLLARLLPRWAAHGLATRLERAMRTTNRAYKLVFPREAFRAAAAAHPGETFVTGHFHTHEVEGNGVALPWAHDGDFMLWQGGTLKPLPQSQHL